VHDVNFAVTDTAEWPEHCQPLQDTNNHQVSYFFTLSCVSREEFCAPQEDTVDCADNAELVLAEEDFETSEHSKNWIRNWDEDKTEFNSQLTNFLGPLSKSKTELSRTLVMPPDAESVLIEFDFYEIDQWGRDDNVFLRMNELYLNFGQFSEANQTESESPISGYFFKSQGVEKRIPVSMMHTPDANDRNHRMSFNVPKYYFPDGRLITGFRVKINETAASESVGFDNFKATASCVGGGSSTPSPTLKPTDTAELSSEADNSATDDCADGNDIAVSYEDFETPGQTDTWTDGLESYELGSTILGRFGQQNPRSSKTFTVPTAASSLDLSFDWYNTDNFVFDVGSTCTNACLLLPLPKP